MLWPSTSLKISVIILFFAGNIPGLLSEGSVGCLYSERICLEEEWCYNDLVFGRCLRSYGDVDEDDLYRFFLGRESLHELNSELRKLFALGYRWNHGYTQCRLQAILYAIKHEMTFEPNSCSHLTDSDLEGALTALEGQVDLDPKEIAVIKYTPSIEDAHAPFADEVFYPPNNNKARDDLRQKILSPNAVDLDLPDPYADVDFNKRAWIPQMKRRSSEQLDFLPYGSDDDFISDITAEGIEEVYATIEFLKDIGLSREEISELLRPENYDKLDKLIGTFGRPEGKPKDVQDMLREELEAEKELENAAEITRFNEKFNTPDDFRAGWESKDGFPESRIYIDEVNDEEENSEYGSGNSVPQPIFRERQQSQGDDKQVFGKLKEHTDQSAPGVYSEGGVVWSDPINIKNDLSGQGEPLLRSNWDNLLEKYNQAFKRPERLDVKKPGPLFSTGNYKIEATKPTKPAMMKKEPRGVHPNPDFEQARKENQDSHDYVYISFKSDLINWRHGRHIMGNLSEILKLDPKTLDDSRVFGDYIVFRVLPNSRGLNATEVAKEIVSSKTNIEKVAELEVKSVSIGNRENKEIEIMAATYYSDQFYVIIFMICGVLGAMIIASALLIFIRKHVKLREKLQGLVKFDTEAIKVHPETSKSKVINKGQLSGDTMHSRLSKESEQSPSSRSSTSSWTEEPALHNMDISTGHMVLSYMEDHLKNKDRLEQEWVALCAYVAEPCEISIAAKKSNKPNNRYPEVVPYDHARVVLNDLINVNGSDYINASSITDHDPRNPAYIATQGPLPHTTPDFWQLIWEQGAVVIVMLTRLTEGGAAMCHRYWPEEGSELYHIYEVHLVSEHIWCDDYLVRSFYLKNIRTGETRTVTQFHFLSWPESGIPASTKALLEFRRKVNKSYRGRSCPIVVHCNDGSGRTGTYCLIDMVLSRMAKGAKEIDIAATLEHLRDQRPRMVATKQQFEFVLTAVAEEVHAILKALPPQPGPAQAPDKEK
ncbi:unnamed protein product [Phyllotreta striolata]|uniref:Receptor-type tyrosine-protein phosphatase N2 n=1 Tax=Phyllotreta striolata TaxID=444603 RepID=A0A9N9TKI8_PHYSR|nr:unnamed protein product [Phyllotreta striolata]